MNNANQSSIALSLSLAVALGTVSADALALKNVETVVPANGVWSCDTLDDATPLYAATDGGNGYTGTPNELECRNAPEEVPDPTGDGYLDP